MADCRSWPRPSRRSSPATGCRRPSESRAFVIGELWGSQPRFSGRSLFGESDRAPLAVGRDPWSPWEPSAQDVPNRESNRSEVGPSGAKGRLTSMPHIRARLSERVSCDGLGRALCFGVSWRSVGRLPMAVGVEVVGEELVDLGGCGADVFRSVVEVEVMPSSTMRSSFGSCACSYSSSL